MAREMDKRDEELAAMREQFERSSKFMCSCMRLCIYIYIYMCVCIYIYVCVCERMVSEYM